MKSRKGKEVDESQLTEEDLMLSFSKGEEWKQWVKAEKESQEIEEKTRKKKSNRNKSRGKYETSLSDVTSFMNLSVFSIPEEKESDLTSSGSTLKVSNMREYSEQPLPNYFDPLSKQFYRYEVQPIKDGDDQQKEEDEESRAGLPPRFPLKDNEDEEVKNRIRDLSNKIRKYTVQCNRLKYLLRKDANAEQQSLQTRQCPCCGKYISKLCFKCEHLYCNPENCPRKKKQKLNARMLEKMKKKKGGHDRQHSRSRNKERKQRKKRNNDDGLEDESFTSDEDSFTVEDFLSESSEEKQEDPALFGYKTRKSSHKPAPTWKMTMSSIGDSQLFLSEAEES